ncbi:MAG: hypothetical protein AB7U76_08540 [Pirellulales bacterium]
MEILLADPWTASNWPIVVAALAAAYILGLPLLILVGMKNDAHPAVEEIDPAADSLPTKIAEHFESAETALQQVGFESEGIFFLPRQVPNAQVIGQLFVNRATFETASAIAIQAGPENNRRLVRYISFVTRYRDGHSIITGNPAEVSAFPVPPKNITTHVPWLQDALELYEVHQAISAAKGSSAPRTIRLFDEFGGDPLAYIAGTIREELDFAAADGYVQLNAAGTCFRATIKGAYLMTWKQLQPFKFFVHRARDRRSNRMLAEVGFD